MKSIYISIPISWHEDTYEQRLNAAIRYVKAKFPEYDRIITPKEVAENLEKEYHQLEPKYKEYLLCDMNAIFTDARSSCTTAKKHGQVCYKPTNTITIMISEQLQRKIDASIKLLRSIQAAHPSEVIEVAYSGGKDSDVILQLAKESGINYEAIYKNTTIDPPGTIKHADEMGCTIMQPRRYTFQQLIERKGMPRRSRRFCCKELKEYKVRDVVVIGIRREESKNRSERYKEPTECRFYGSKKEHVEAIYPILEWTTQDVSDFLQDRGIKCAPVYYDESGVFHPERRLGCMCCPMTSRKKRIAEFKKYKGMVKFYIRAQQMFIDSHPNSKLAKNHVSAIDCFVRDVFCKNAREFDILKSGLFGCTDFKNLLEDYFDIKL